MSRDYVCYQRRHCTGEAQHSGIQEYHLIQAMLWTTQNVSSPQLLESQILELIIIFLAGQQSGWEWQIFDVGGCRTTVGQSYLEESPQADRLIT